ncbi:hypothetical protein Aduo_007758 [Ancylostoma duodenale]
MDEDGSGTGGSIGGLGYWKQNLYLLQERAPKPIAVPCNRVIENRPPQYGNERRTIGNFVDDSYDSLFFKKRACSGQ